MLEPLLVRLVKWMEWRDKRYAGTMHEISTSAEFRVVEIC